MGAGFPFGLLFLLVILALVAVRAPYAGGFLKSARLEDERVPAVQHDPGIARSPPPAIQAETPPEAPMMPAQAAPSSETPEFDSRGAAAS